MPARPKLALGARPSGHIVFAEEPSMSLAATSSGGGGTCPTPDQTQPLQVLLDRDGTGHVTELSRENGGQRFSGEFHRSAREDSTVVDVQAEPVGRARAALTLARLAADPA